jgi:hypothetical protein
MFESFCASYSKIANTLNEMNYHHQDGALKLPPFKVVSITKVSNDNAGYEPVMFVLVEY